jgi:hypothetical protein
MSEGDERLPAIMSGNADVFSSCLQEQELTWLLVSRRDDQHAHLRFTGPFQGRMVVWDCEFVTLSAAQAQRNFIDIGSPEASGVPLHVGLSIAHIDAAAIEKMIVMIRHYKRLRASRYEYGEAQG